MTTPQPREEDAKFLIECYCGYLMATKPTSTRRRASGRGELGYRVFELHTGRAFFANNLTANWRGHEALAVISR